MAGGKRASMREGPLAALFRGTAELEAEEKAEKERREVQPPRAPEPPPRAPEPPPPAPEPVAEEPPAEPRVPSPQERLRAAFSSDIPENVMAPPAPPRHDPYERPADPPSFAEQRPTGAPIIRVIGVGGAGVNAVNRMIEAEVAGVEFIAINTDLQSLQQSTADITLHIGSEITRGLGSGSNPDLGRQAAMEEHDKIKALLKGSDMVFITAGSG